MFTRVSCSTGPAGEVRVEVFADGQGTSRTLTIRPCLGDPLTAEFEFDESVQLQIVPCVDPAEFQQAIQRAILECVPENLDDQFAQLMVDLRSSESLEELQRQLRTLTDPAARTIIEQLIVLREAVEVSNPSRAEKRRLLHRTNEALLLFANFLASKGRSTIEGRC